MAKCPSCDSPHYFNGDCEDCRYNWNTGRPPKQAGGGADAQLKRIADALEKIERHMAFNNGTLEGMTRNYDPDLNRR